jgi:hypothetical protein
MASPMVLRFHNSIVMSLIEAKDLLSSSYVAFRGGWIE